MNDAMAAPHRNRHRHHKRVTMKQLLLTREAKYNEDLSMKAVWAREIKLPQPLQLLDPKRTCLVKFKKEQFATCAQKAWQVTFVLTRRLQDVLLDEKVRE